MAHWVATGGSVLDAPLNPTPGEVNNIYPYATITIQDMWQYYTFVNGKNTLIRMLGFATENSTYNDTVEILGKQVDVEYSAYVVVYPPNKIYSINNKRVYDNYLSASLDVMTQSTNAELRRLMAEGLKYEYGKPQNYRTSAGYVYLYLMISKIGNITPLRWIAQYNNTEYKDVGYDATCCAVLRAVSKRLNTILPNSSGYTIPTPDYKSAYSSGVQIRRPQWVTAQGGRGSIKSYPLRNDIWALNTVMYNRKKYAEHKIKLNSYFIPSWGLSGNFATVADYPPGGWYYSKLYGSSSSPEKEPILWWLSSGSKIFHNIISYKPVRSGSDVWAYNPYASLSIGTENKGFPNYSDRIYMQFIAPIDAVYMNQLFNTGELKVRTRSTMGGWPVLEELETAALPEFGYYEDGKFIPFGGD